MELELVIGRLEEASKEVLYLLGRLEILEQWIADLKTDASFAYENIDALRREIEKATDRWKCPRCGEHLDHPSEKYRMMHKHCHDAMKEAE